MRPRFVRTAAVAVLALAAACSGDSTGIPVDEIPDFLDCTRLSRVEVGQTASGALRSGDCVLAEDGSLIDYYRLRIGSTRTVTITMSSDDVDSFLFVFDANGEVIGANDDAFDDNFDAQLSGQLPAGTYYVGANSLEPGETGDYTLRVQ